MSWIPGPASTSLVRPWQLRRSLALASTRAAPPARGEWMAAGAGRYRWGAALDLDAMIDAELAAIASLRAAGRHADAHARATDLARLHPGDVRARIAAGQACERIGDPAAALIHYDRAWQLGVPASARPGFLIGYGATLRSCGRVDEAVARLGEAVIDYPDHAALRAFLALALHSAGQATLALATMLEAALAAARPDGFAGHDQALAHHLHHLVEAVLT